MDKDNFRKLTESLSLYHRITANKYSESDSNCDELLKELYVDILPDEGILKKVLERKTTFLVGRKGTGKSTVISRAQHEIHTLKKDICIYINAKTIYKSCEIDEINFNLSNIDDYLTNDEILKLKLLKKSINSLCKNMLEELEKEDYNIFEKISNKLVRDKRLDKVMNELNKLVETPIFTNVNRILKTQTESSVSEEVITELKASLNTGVDGSIKCVSGAKENCDYSHTLARIFNISEIISKFTTILDICNRNNIFIFIDDYSELSRGERKIFMDTIIAPMYHIGVDKINFKIACYPNKIAPLNLDSGKYSMTSIDLYDVYGQNNNISVTEKLATEYIERLLTNRSEKYCENDIQYYFDLKNNSMNDYYKILHKVSMNIPRVLGHVLNNCYLKNIVYNKPITVATIKDASKQYYNDHIAVELGKKIASSDLNKDDKVDIFVLESLIEKMIKASQSNKYDLPKRDNSYFNNLQEAYTSHFMISLENEQYLEELEFYGFVHKINKIANKGRKIEDYKNNNNYLFAFDYGLCQEEKILYGKPEESDTKYYQQRAFLYDEIILLALKVNKKIVCTNDECKSIFSIEQLDLFKKFRMKCMNCSDGFCSIQFDEKLLTKAEDTIKKSILTQQEIDIIYAVDIICKENNESYVSANEISGEIDYSSRLIANKCKVLYNDGYIKRDTSNKPYKYAITEKSKNIINILLKKND